MTPPGGAEDAPTEPLPEIRGGDSTAPPPAEPAPATSTVARAGVVAAVALAVVLVALLLLNAWVTRSAEDTASDRASEALDAPATVRLTGWPVGLRLAAGRPVDAVVQASEVPIPGTGALLSRLVVELDEVLVDRRALEDGSRGLEAATGRFVAELDAAAVQELAGLIGRLPLVGVELRSGVARLAVAGFPVLDATAEVEGGAVVFRPTAPLGSFARVQLEFDELPMGFRADDVEIRRNLLRLEGSARDVRIG